MAFKAEALIEKLGKLNATQQSIETTSQWCIFYRKDAKKVVETWSTEFSRTKDVNKRLAMIYLANDVLQNSRKKGAQFVVEFYHKLPLAMQQLVKQGDSKVQGSMMRMIQVWDERRVFGGSGVRPFLDALKGTSKPGQRHVVLQSAQPSVERLSTATRDAAEAHERSTALAERSQAVVCQDLSSSSAEELSVGLKTLQQHSASLQNEIGHCDLILSILQQLTSQQEEAKQLAERQLEGCQQMGQRHQQVLQERQKADASMPQAQSHESEAAQPVAEASEAEPTPGNGRHLPQTGDGPTSLPGTTPSSADAMSQLLAGFRQGDGARGSTAADLVAQLSQSGASAQMLFDAISALPQVDQQAGAAPKPPEEEEYDPEIGL